MRRYIACFITFFTLTGFTVEKDIVVSKIYSLQPEDERKAQEALPKSRDMLWTTLAATKIKVDNIKGVYDAVFTDSVRKLNGTSVTISGFMLPLESAETFKHFLLSKRTPTCFFCPPGEPNEVIEITTDKPVKWDENLVTYTGVFKLVNNREMGIFFQMNHAAKK